MTTTAVVSALLTVLQTVPTILPVVQKLVTDIAAGRGNKEVTPEDIAELVRLAGQSATDIYAKEGVTPPPTASS